VSIFLSHHFPIFADGKPVTGTGSCFQNLSDCGDDFGDLNAESFEKAGTSVFAEGANYADLFTDPVFWGSIWCPSPRSRASRF
jgi:hypothetical protein